MSETEEQFYKKLLAAFRIEAEEHLRALSDGLIALEGGLPQEEQKKTVEAIFREAHTFKGAARSVNLKSVPEVCQILEDILELWKRGKLIPSKQIFNTLYATVDYLGQAVTAQPDPKTANDLVQKLDEIKNGKISEEVPQLPPSPEKKIEVSVEVPREDPLPISQKADTSSEKIIRVSLPKLDRLLQEVEEMLMVKQAYQQESADLKQLLVDIGGKEKEIARLLPSIQALKQSQEPMQKILALMDGQQKLIKFTKERLIKIAKSSEINAHVVGSMVDTLLEDIKKVLMQPVNTLFETFPRMVRDIAHEKGKEVHVEFEGGHIEVDRRILEVLKDPFIHLIRNAIDHGIELPDARVAKGKPKYGTIKIVASETGGSSVEFQFSDDGKGIDVEKITEAAIQQNLVTAKDAKKLSSEEVMKFSLHSGISTSTAVTDLSGRGLGLGIVSEKVDKLGGHLQIESEKNHGAKFKMVLPLTLATFRGIRILVGDHDFIVPAHNVVQVIRLNAKEIKTLENCESIFVRGTSLSFIHLADLFNLPRKKLQNEKNYTLFALIVKGADKTVAFGADMIYGEHEVLVKNLGTQCIRVKNIMAATIMEWGKIIPILNPLDLIRSLVKGRGPLIHPPELVLEKDVRKKTILLAEDSITTRLLMKNILESSGFDVKAAVDGLEALSILQSESIDLLLTDVEMPNMDGFTLVEKVKGMKLFKDLPVIICTARASKEDRERGMILGANGYLDKSSFTQQALLKMVHNLV